MLSASTQIKSNKNQNNFKVIHFITSFDRGGRERQLASILKNTPDIAVVFNKVNNSYIEEYGISQKIIFLDITPPTNRFFRLFYILKKEKPTIIYSWGGLEAIYCTVLSLFTSTRHINGSIRHGIVQFKNSHIIRMITLHLSRFIVANSKAGLSANKLKRGYVLYNGLDEKFFEKVGKNKIKVKEQTSKYRNGDVPIFISVANMVPYKDYSTILNALELLKINGERFLYYIIGDGPNRELIERQIEKKSLNEDVILLGKRVDVEDWLLKADLFIHSSRGEGCSNAILEAMAAGLPVVATNTGGTSEIVDESFGLLFDFGDHKGLYRNIMLLLSDPALLQEKGQKARQTAMNRFSIGRMLDDYKMIVEKVANS